MAAAVVPVEAWIDLLDVGVVYGLLALLRSS